MKKVECQGDYDSKIDAKMPNSNFCLVNISKSKKPEDFKEPPPEYNAVELAVGHMNLSHVSRTKVTNLSKQLGRDNKMYFLSDNSNLEKPDKLMIQ